MRPSRKLTKPDEPPGHGFGRAGSLCNGTCRCNFVFQGYSSQRFALSRAPGVVAMQVRAMPGSLWLAGHEWIIAKLADQHYFGPSLS
jgi:hypothetical protein